MSEAMVSGESGAIVESGIVPAIWHAEAVDLGLCHAHGRNYVRHSPEQIALLRQSLRRFTQVRSVVLQDDGAGGFTIVAGHGICEAARLEGLTTVKADIIPVEWPEEQVLAYLAADNQLASRDSDEEQLAAILRDVQGRAGTELALLAAGTAERLKALAGRVERQEYGFLAGAESSTQGHAGRKEEEPAERAERALYPLAIVLTADENRSWQEYKRGRGVTGDKAAFLALWHTEGA